MYGRVIGIQIQNCRLQSASRLHAPYKKPTTKYKQTNKRTKQNTFQRPWTKYLCFFADRPCTILNHFNRYSFYLPCRFKISHTAQHSKHCTTPLKTFQWTGMPYAEQFDIYIWGSLYIYAHKTFIKLNPKIRQIHFGDKPMIMNHKCIHAGTCRLLM